MHPVPPPSLIVAKVTSRKCWSGKRSLAFHYASMLKEIKKNMHHTHMKNVQKLCKIICGKWLCNAKLHMNNYQTKILNLRGKYQDSDGKTLVMACGCSSGLHLISDTKWLVSKGFPMALIKSLCKKTPRTWKKSRHVISCKAHSILSHHPWR